MSEANKRLVLRWFEEVWNNGRAEAIEELFAENGIAHGLSEDPDNPVRGPKDYRPFHSMLRGAFPNIKVVVEDMIAEGDKVTARCLVQGKHEGDHLGIEATNQEVDFTGITIVRIADGQIVEAWNNFDFSKMNKQIGL